MHSIEKIENEYKIMLDRYTNRNKETSGTGMQNVLQLLVDHPDKIWWFSWELLGKRNSKGDWISHRGPARASDLAIKHPDLVEDRKVGRFCVYRAKLENTDKIKQFLQ